MSDELAEIARQAREAAANKVLGIEPEPELPATRRTYTHDQQMVGLVTLARCYGSPAQAAKLLQAERDLEIPVATLRDWRNSADYERIARDYAVQLESALIREARENAHAAAAVERKAIEKAEQMLDHHTTRLAEVAQTARAMTEVKAKNLDKVLVMTGRPKEIVERRDFEDVVQSLLSKRIVSVAPDVEGTAEDVHDDA